MERLGEAIALMDRFRQDSDGMAAYYLASQGRIKEARDLLKRNGSLEARARMEIATQLVANGCLDEATSAIAEIGGSFQKLQVRIRLACALAESGDVVRAEQQLLAVWSDIPSLPDVRYEPEAWLDVGSAMLAAGMGDRLPDLLCAAWLQAETPGRLTASINGAGPLGETRSGLGYEFFAATGWVIKFLEDWSTQG
jgi:hypothetical protein